LRREWTKDPEDLYHFHYIILYILVHISISLDYQPGCSEQFTITVYAKWPCQLQVLLSFIRKIIRSFHFISTSSSTAMVSFDHPVVRLLGSRSSSSSSLISASPPKQRVYSLGISPLAFSIPKRILSIHLYSLVNRFILFQLVLKLLH
jgi:hypothetical protein